MAQVIHKLMRDGSVEHVPFESKDDWYDALRDPGCERRWTHRPGECCDPVEEILDRCSSRSLFDRIKLQIEGESQNVPEKV